MSNEFDGFDELEEMEDDLDLTLYADSIELTNEVVVSTLLTIDEGLDPQRRISFSAHRRNFRSSYFRGAHH
jgi:hypothetical protein